MGDADAIMRPGTDDGDIDNGGSGEEIADEKNPPEVCSSLTMKTTGSFLKREKWGSKTQFLMSCIASAVGLGNVWRFPAVMAKYGGTSFFIPYMIVLFVIARPIFLLELALGQFSSKGSVRCWDLSPIFTGLGYAGALSSVLLSTFYILLMAWSLFYTYQCGLGLITGELPWKAIGAGPYFGGEVLQELKFDDLGNGTFKNWMPICHLVLSLLIAWMIIWFSMVGGVEASGKFAYVTALAPYFVLITLLVVGSCLQGASQGITYLLTPDWSRLISAETWYEAVGQCFFSLGIGFGGLIMFSSFNDFHHDIFKDVLIISLVDFLTSVLAGLSLMTILGFQATQEYHKMKPNSTERNDLFRKCLKKQGALNEMDFGIQCQLQKIVDKGGAGLAFVQYPAAMQQINESWGYHLGGLFGMMFFIMLILLATGSANGFVGTTVTIISDKRSKWKRSSIVSGICATSFFMGLIYTNRFGSNWIDVVDQHGVTAVVYILAFIESVAVVFVYGLKNFCDDLEFMRNGKRVSWYFKITWVMLPVFLFVVYIVWIINYNKQEFLEHLTPTVKVVAWLLTLTCVLALPVVAIMKILEFKKKPWHRDTPTDIISTFKAVCKPSRKWGPRDPEILAAWKEFKQGRNQSYNIFSNNLTFFSRLFRKQAVIVAPVIEEPTYTSSTYHPDNLDPLESGSGSVEANLDSVGGSSSSTAS